MLSLAFNCVERPWQHKKMTTSDFDLSTKPSADPIDRLIFEQGLRIKRLFFDLELDRMLVLLTNGNVLNLKISGFPRLKFAPPGQLDDYVLEGGGVAVRWESLDEDLSVKGFIRQAALEEVFHLA